jgi:hypothetical protein
LAGHEGVPLQLPNAQQMVPNWLDKHASAPAGGIDRFQANVRQHNQKVCNNQSQW